MQKVLIRKFSALLALTAIWFSAISFFPAGIAAQTVEEKTSSKKDKKNAEKKAQKELSQVQTAANKTLSQNEDPSLIGKRKINGGSDKFFGWLGGSQDKEVALGRMLSMEVEQQSKLVEDPVITEYVNRVGQNIVLHSDSKLPFTIKVIDSEEVNAFALPGGFFYVNKGLILAADNESELAGVMAHEIAHVAARHAMENQGKASAMNYGMLAGIIFGGGILSSVLQNVGGIGGALAGLKFSRGAEEEADKLGVQYLYAAGYDPTSMSTMFEKLASKNKKKPGFAKKIFSTHPQSIERRDSSLALVARFPEQEEYVISTSEFQRVKAHLLRLTNSKALINGDLDEGEPGKPTLKRRQPEADSNGEPGVSSSDKTDVPPKLKKRGEEPVPTPTPQ